MARWHFRMLNDSTRNSAFKKAIQYWIRKGEKVDVMDIGSGTGLLSMYAANVANVKSISAIECNPIMSQISTEVFNSSVRGKLVRMITKHSKDLTVGEDVPSKVSLIVSETLDAGAFGEGVLDTLIHAKQNFLKPDGKIVPWKVKIFVAGYKSEILSFNQMITNNTFEEYFFLENIQLVAKQDEPYDAEYVDNIGDFKIVTTCTEALEVDFNDLSSMQQHFDGTAIREFEVESIVSNDYMDGFVAWFHLYLNEEDPENVLTTEAGSGSCWQQVIFKLKERVLLEKDQILEQWISCKDGILRLNHDIDANPETQVITVDREMLCYLNDEEYLGELEFAVSRHDHKFINCLDLSPFPYVGMLLLKDSRLQKLWCRKRDEELITMIAEKNLVDLSRFEFIADVDVLQTKFELIILHPFHPLGDLDSEIISSYPKYRNLLTANGLLVPGKISVYGELINSDWLMDSCRVSEVGVKRFGIDHFINKYATEVQLDLDITLDCERLTRTFKISEVHLDENLHESNVDVPIRNINLPVQAIFYHHLIQLSPKVPEFSTDRKTQTSCFKRSAQVMPVELTIDSSTVKISFIQNSGIVKCDVVT